MEKGTRVKLSALGCERLLGNYSKHDPERMGTFTGRLVKGIYPDILWDGRTSVQCLHPDFIEIVGIIHHPKGGG